MLTLLLLQDSTRTAEGGSLPQSPILWLAGFLLLAVVLVFALSNGRGNFVLEFLGLKTKVENNPGADKAIVVASDSNFKGDVGKIAAVRGGENVAVNRPIDAGSRSTFDGKVDEIVGVDVTKKE